VPTFAAGGVLSQNRSNIFQPLLRERKAKRAGGPHDWRAISPRLIYRPYRVAVSVKSRKLKKPTRRQPLAWEIYHLKIIAGRVRRLGYADDAESAIAAAIEQHKIPAGRGRVFCTCHRIWGTSHSA
jgi:hypothetical protein